MNLSLVTNNDFEAFTRLCHSGDLVHAYYFYSVDRKERCIPNNGDTIVSIGLVYNKCIAFKDHPYQELLDTIYLSTRIPEEVVFKCCGEVLFVWKIEDKYKVQEIENKICVFLEIPFLTPGLRTVGLISCLYINTQNLDVEQFIVVHGYHNSWIRSAISWETQYIKSHMIPNLEDGTKAMVKIDYKMHRVPYEENPKYEFNPSHGDKSQQGKGNPHYKKLLGIKS